MCQIINETGANKKLLALLSSLQNDTPYSSTNTRFIAQVSRSIGEMAATLVYYGKEKWFYFYGRFGTSSKWIQPTSPSFHREVPARIFANAIVFFHKVTEAFEASGIEKSPSQINVGLDELEMVRLWLFLMIEPNYTMLQGLFTHSLIRKFELIQKPCLWITKLLPKETMLPLCENHQKIFEHRKKIMYLFLGQLCKILLPDGAVPTLENISLFYNWFQTIPRRLTFMLLKELPAELVKQSSRVLVDHTQFCYSFVGRLLSHCTFLLYRPKCSHCLLPTILSNFFKTKSLDLSYRLQYLPRVVEAFGKLSEVYSMQGDQCLQREFKEIFYFYWDVLLRHKDEQKRIIHAWAFAFAEGSHVKLRRYFVMQVLFPKFEQGGETMQLALKVATQVLYSVDKDASELLDHISTIGAHLIRLMTTKRGNGTSLADRVVIHSFWLRMLHKVQHSHLEPEDDRSLFRSVVEMFILILLDDLLRLFSSTIHTIGNQHLSSQFLQLVSIL